MPYRPRARAGENADRVCRGQVVRGILTGVALIIGATSCATYSPLELPDSEYDTAKSTEANQDQTEIQQADTMRKHEATAEAIERVVDEAPDREAFHELYQTIEALSHAPIYKNSHARLLVDGPATYQAMLDAIANARHYVHLETFIFADDKIGQRFADALVQKQEQGVAVRVIYDSIGSYQSSDAFFERMRDAGIEVLEFHGINPLDGGNPLNANNRDHRKLLIVDGRVAFTGGINLTSTYASSSSSTRRLKNPKHEGWRDTHIEITGPAVAAFEKTFQENWISEGGSEVQISNMVPPPVKTGNDLIAALQSEGGDDTESPIWHAYLKAMELAKERIWITQAYFSPDDKFIELLSNAAARGVDVRLIVPGFSDSEMLLHASRSQYGDLLKRGVKVYENTSALLHAKTAVIDSVWSTVGSSNLDYRSFLHNDEVNAIIFGSDFAGQLEAQFLQDIDQCRSITLEEWQNRPVTDRLKEMLSWTLNYWL